LTTSSQERIIKERKEKVKNMKIQYEVNDEVIMTRSIGRLLEGQIVKITDTEYTYRVEYLVEDDNFSAWVGEDDIEPATISLLTKMNEAEITEYIGMILKDENKKCLEFLAKNPSEYFTPEEIYKNANISFTSLKTLERKLIHQSELPYWKSEELGYEVTYKLKPNKKKYYGDDGSVLFRGKSEHCFCAVKKVKEVYNDNEEECEEDE